MIAAILEAVLGAAVFFIAYRIGFSRGNRHGYIVGRGASQVLPRTCTAAEPIPVGGNVRVVGDLAWWVR